MPFRNPQDGPDWPRTIAELQAQLDQLNAIISQVGHAVLKVTHTTPQGLNVPFCYSVGLAAQGFPEIFVIGAPHEAGRQAINNVVDQMRRGSLKCSVPQSKILNAPVYLMPVTPENASLLSVAKARAHQPVPALQIVCPDERDLFPWEKNFNPNMGLIQPLAYLPSGDKPSPPVPATAGGDDPRTFAAKFLLQDRAADAGIAPSSSAPRSPRRSVH